MRTVILAVVSLGLGFTACSSYDGTSTISADKKPVASVSVSLPSPTMMAGQTERGTAVARDATGAPLTDRNVTWQSSNPLAANVDDSGMISAVAPGASTISAWSEGVSGQGALTVVSPPPGPVATVSVSPGSPNLQIGGTAQLSATTRDASGNALSGRAVAWSSGNAGIASVSGSGVVTAVAAGSTAITATSEGQSGSASVTVTAAPPVAVATVSITPASPGVAVGATTQLTAVTRDAGGNVLTGRVVTWSSGTPANATVSGSGLATGVAVGTSTITATSQGRSGTVSLTVTASGPAAVASVTLSPSAPSVVAGGQVQLSATTRDAAGTILTGRTVTWRSSNTGLATVSGSGLVSGVNVGSATITATSGTVNGTATVAITAPPTPPNVTAPEPVAGDVTLWQDNFDKSSLTELLNPYATRGDMALVPGRSGSAVRFLYSSGSSDNLVEKTFAQSTDVYFRFYYRLSVGADPTCGERGDSGMKWFMAWRPDPGPRYTMGVGHLDGGPTTAQPNRGNEFTTHDNSSSQMPNPFLSNINKNLRFSTTNDGNWHEYTLHIVTGNGGYEQIWIDGVLVLDNSSYHYDHSAIGVAMVQFPGTVVNWFSGCDFTIDVDDLVIWHK